MFCGRRHCADGRDRVEDHVEDLVKPVLAAQWARTAAAPIAKPSTSASGLLGACPDCLRRGCRRADLAPTGKRHLFTHAGIEPRAKKFAAAAVKGLAEWFVVFRDGGRRSLASTTRSHFFFAISKLTDLPPAKWRFSRLL
jgi:hypothetical protein